jgi:sugar/nucleoside kinase (ribokinase family)
MKIAETIMNKRLAGLGLATVDLIGEVDVIPREDEMVYMLSHEKQAGGVVSNALAAAARLGLRSAWIGKVGDDDYGAFIINEMKKDGVDVSLASVEKGAVTPFSFILVDRKTRGRSIIFNPGCSGAFGAEIPAETIARFDALHLDGFFPDAAVSAAHKAREHGVEVFLDAGFMFPALDTLLELTDVFVPTMEVAEKITGEADAGKALRALAARGLRMAAVTMGAHGSAGICDGRLSFAPAFEIEAVDTTAAGDTFHGAFIFARLAGWPLEKILVFANAAAAVKCSRPGARKGIPCFDDVAHFLKTRNIDL